MPRLRNRDNGVVVNVSDDTAALLDEGMWELADKPTPAPVKKVAAKATTKPE